MGNCPSDHSRLSSASIFLLWLGLGPSQSLPWLGMCVFHTRTPLVNRWCTLPYMSIAYRWHPVWSRPLQFNELIAFIHGLQPNGYSTYQVTAEVFEIKYFSGKEEVQNYNPKSLEKWSRTVLPRYKRIQLFRFHFRIFIYKGDCPVFWNLGS